ncbi:MAG: hypothetical protein BYD32DRAFT_458124 [Podila humilis]|nr:MAG: hypothetical protein BYD32DRAFT_458124 [Podila humilis]
MTHLPSYYYPFLGIIYLIRNISQLGPQFLRSLCVSFGLTLAVLAPVVALTFKYQRRLIHGLTRALFLRVLSDSRFLGISIPTWSALILTMGEASFLVALIMTEVFKKEKSKGLFKTILARRNVVLGPLAQVSKSGLISVSHMEHEEGIKESQKCVSPSPSHVVAKASAKSQQMAQRVGLWLLTLPLNFFPVAGPITFCYFNGKARVPDIHRRYFDMKRMTKSERENWIKAHEMQYTAFGFVAQGLELAPIIGIAFGFTNIIGAALWAVDLEKEQDALRNKKLLKDANSSKVIEN